jgi:hypothetical protein
MRIAMKITGGQEADEERRQTHDHDRDEERVLAPDHIAEAPEHDRAERPHRETRGKAEKRENEGGGRIDAGEKALADESRERTGQIEVVPLENRTQRRCEDHPLLFSRHRRMRELPANGSHVSSPILICTRFAGKASPWNRLLEWKLTGY